MDKDRKGIDWLGVIVRFVFGAALGAGVGFLVWIYAGDPYGPCRWHVLAGAGALGMLSAIYGDRFWMGIASSSLNKEAPRYSWRWWWWRRR